MNAVTPETTKEGFELKPGFYTFGKLTSGHEQEDWLPDKAVEIKIGSKGQLIIKPSEDLYKVCIVSVYNKEVTHYILCPRLRLGELEGESLKSQQFEFQLVTTTKITPLDPENTKGVIISLLDSDYWPPGMGGIRMILNLRNSISTQGFQESIQRIPKASFAFHTDEGRWVLEGVSKIQMIERPPVPLPPKPASGTPTKNLGGVAPTGGSTIILPKPIQT